MKINYLLDSDIIIDIFDYSKVPPLGLNINIDCYISSLTYFEVSIGAIKRGKSLDNFIAEAGIGVIEFKTKEAETASRIYCDLENKGLKIGEFDICIAATAVENNLTLVTNNTKHFLRIKGLKLFGY